MKRYVYFVRYSAHSPNIPEVHGNAELTLDHKISRMTDFDRFKQVVEDKIEREVKLSLRQHFEGVTIDFYQLLRVEEVDEENT